MSPTVSEYLDRVCKGMVPVSRCRFIRSLFNLSLKISAPLFLKTIARASQYQITDFSTIERIAVYLMRDDHFDSPLFDLHEGFKERDGYELAEVCEPPDLSKYNRWFDDDGSGT